MTRNIFRPRIAEIKQELKDQFLKNQGGCVTQLLSQPSQPSLSELARLANKKVDDKQRLKEKVEKEALDAKKAEERQRRQSESGKENAGEGVKAKTIRLTTLKCANFVCRATCIKDSPEHDKWLPCQNNKCKLIFCPACADSLTAHQQHGH